MTNPVDYVMRFNWNDLHEVARVLDEWGAPPINVNDVSTMAVFGGYYGKASVVLNTWASLYNAGQLTSGHFPSDFKQDLLDAWSLKTPLSRIQSLRLFMCLGQDNWRTKAQESKQPVQEKPLYGFVGWTTNARLGHPLHRMEIYKDRIELIPVDTGSTGYARIQDRPIHIFPRSILTEVKFPIQGPHAWWEFGTNETSVKIESETSGGKSISIALVAMMDGEIDAQTLKQGEEYVDNMRNEHAKKVMNRRIFWGVGIAAALIALVLLFKR